MGKYGKQCKKDSDCPSKICEMTYFNNDTKRPDSRKCVNMSYKSLDIEGGINVINKKKSVFTSKKCSFNELSFVILNPVEETIPPALAL